MGERSTGQAGLEAAGGAGDFGGMFGSIIQAAGQALDGPGTAAIGQGANAVGNHMGGAASVLGLGTGIYNMIAGDTTTDRVMGGLNAATGAIGTGGWIGSLMGVETGLLGGLGSVGGAAGLNGGAFAASTWGAGAASGGAAAGTALATGGAVLGAGLAGYGIGSYGNEAAKKYGLFGTGEDGESRSGSDWAADNGRSVDSWVDDWTGNDTLGDIAGGVTVLGSSIAAMPGVVGGALMGAGSAALSFVGGIFSW